MCTFGFCASSRIELRHSSNTSSLVSPAIIPSVKASAARSGSE